MTNAELLADLLTHGLAPDGTVDPGYLSDLSDDPALLRRVRALLRSLAQTAASAQIQTMPRHSVVSTKNHPAHPAHPAHAGRPARQPPPSR